jgi:hypothetical protein
MGVSPMPGIWLKVNGTLRQPTWSVCVERHINGSNWVGWSSRVASARTYFIYIALEFEVTQFVT